MYICRLEKTYNIVPFDMTAKCLKDLKLIGVKSVNCSDFDNAIFTCVYLGKKGTLDNFEVKLNDFIVWECKEYPKFKTVNAEEFKKTYLIVEGFENYGIPKEDEDTEEFDILKNL